MLGVELLTAAWVDLDQPEVRAVVEWHWESLEAA
jgi:hypothetical protein